jgi:rRNA processing protein Gar1
MNEFEPQHQEEEDGEVLYDDLQMVQNIAMQETHMAMELEKAREALLMSRNTASQTETSMQLCSDTTADDGEGAEGGDVTSDDEEIDQALALARQELDALLSKRGFEVIPDDDEEDDMSTICMQPGVEEKQVLQIDFSQFGEPLDAFVTVLPNQQMERLGKIQSLMENSVIVHALAELPSLDVDSVVFWKDKKPLGKIIDLFGPVRSPFYIIRVDQASRDQVLKGLEVAFGPDAPIDAGRQLHVFYIKDHAKFVCPAQLMTQQENTAIDEDDTEVLYFSDDEKEREYLKSVKKGKSKDKRGGEFSAPSAPSQSSNVAPEFKKPLKKNFRRSETEGNGHRVPRPPRPQFNNSRPPVPPQRRYNSYDLDEHQLPLHAPSQGFGAPRFPPLQSHYAPQGHFQAPQYYPPHHQSFQGPPQAPSFYGGHPMVPPPPQPNYNFQYPPQYYPAPAPQSYSGFNQSQAQPQPQSQQSLPYFPTQLNFDEQGPSNSYVHQ